MAVELYDVLVALLGLAVLGTGLLPRYLEQLPVSRAMLFLGGGILLFWLPLGVPAPDPFEHGTIVKRLTEAGVIVALMVAGLKLDRPPGLRRWASTWRLLGITMPLTIAAVALVGLWVGLAVPTAVLLGAVIAPTDPVLATEVQVEGPEGGSEGEDRPDAAGMRDETRFALTSEAGLNDGLAFPFTNLAVAMALAGVPVGNWAGEWLLVDVGYRIAVALVGGLGLGYLLAAAIFARRIEPEMPTATSMLGLEAVGATFVVYGVVEVVGGYGFISVFLAATVIRHYGGPQAYYEELHDATEKLEQALMAGIMVFFGGLIVGGLFEPLTVELVVAALVVVFLVRPLAGVVGLLGFDRSWAERSTIAVYGIRGIGTFYYLAFALGEAPFPGAEALWALAGSIAFVSIVFHGVTATHVVEVFLGEESPSVEPPASS